MAGTQRYISTSFWDDPWVVSLSPDERYLYLYFLTNTLTNIAGIYQISLDRICFDSKFDAEKVKNIICKFENDGKAYFFNNSYIILPKWPKHQRWQSHKKIEVGIKAILISLPMEILSFLKKIGYAYPIDSLCIPYAYPQNYSDKDIDTDKDIDSDSPSDSFSFPEKNTQDQNPPDPIPDKPAETKEDVTRIFNKARELWNELKIPPECRDIMIPPSQYDCLPIFQNYTWVEIANAIKNYHWHKTGKCGPGWSQAPSYGSIYGFLKTGVARYFNDDAAKAQFFTQEKVNGVRR